MQWTMAALVLVLAYPGATGAADLVVGWRTDGTGRYPEATPPLRWSAEQHVVWQTDLGAWSNATPVVVGERVFVGVEPATLACLDRGTGQVRWQREHAILDALSPERAEAVRQALADAEPDFRQLHQLEREVRGLRHKLRRDRDNAELKARVQELSTRINALNEKLEPVAAYTRPPTHNANGYSSPTCVVGGDRVYALFGTGVAACYDLDGNRQWIRQVGRPPHGWGHSTSPLLAGDTLLVQVDDLVGLDAATGEPRWNLRLPNKWGTPVVTRVGGTDVAIMPTGHFVRARDGKVLASLPPLAYAAPVVHEGVVYFIEKRAGAYRLPAEAGETIELERLWQASIKGDRHYSSPVVHDGLIYTIARRQEFTILDAATGEVVLEKTLDLPGSGPNQVYASVTLAGGHLFVTAESGTTVVLEPGRTYRELARNELPSPLRSSPVFAGDRLYLRAGSSMFCIGAP